MRRAARSSGFSLVELSIVLVILGLLVGGILSGQSLIRASELRSITTEYQRYTTAVGTFRDKYFALPGDMPNAQLFWTTAPTGDGDGDGLIENNSGDSELNEISTFWIDLTLAGLVEGSFSQTATTTMVAGTHNPRAKMSNAAWNVAHIGTVAADGVSSPVAGSKRRCRRWRRRRTR